MTHMMKWTWGKSEVVTLRAEILAWRRAASYAVLSPDGTPVGVPIAREDLPNFIADALRYRAITFKPLEEFQAAYDASRAEAEEREKP
jgi:hypothetical protein